MTSVDASIRYRFGHFELQPEERQLLADGTPVRLGPHAFDLLVALVEHSGHLLTKEALLARVWGRVVVEENTLQVHISGLRKVLGPDTIATVPGRGYRFVPQVVQAGADSTSTPAPRRHNLPHQVTSFVGREKESAQLKGLLGSTRLLTLTGAGGCGKTRLAQQVAGEVLDAYPDGSWLVELAPLGDPTLIPQTVATALGVQELGAGDPVETIADWIATKRMLLMLDNAEHLLEASAELVDRLLRRCARLALLVTSRERLGVAGELTYRVPSLSLPESTQSGTSEGALACESAQLFIERARMHRPDLAISAKDATALTSICRRLDGIALAIELAAPRVRVMSLAELSRHLEDRFDLLTGGPRTALPRHRTLRSLIDWSHDLLTAPERAVLRRASVFAGGWTIEGAERVCCHEGINQGDVLDVLTSLADKSLVIADARAESTRFGMLETVRHYALHRLRESGEEDLVRARHVDYFLDAANKLAEQQDDSDRQAKLKGLDREHDNLRSALAWCETAAPCAQSGLRLAGKLYWFWRARGHYGEGRSWVDRLLAVAAGAEPAKDHATALTTAGVLAYFQGDHSVAEAQWRGALAIRQRLGQRRHVAALLNNLGSVALIRDDDPRHQAARALYEEALAISRELGDRQDVGFRLYSLGILFFVIDDYDKAQSLLEESVSIRREFGRLGAAESLAELGKIRHALGDNRSARTLLIEALASDREFGNRPGIARALVWLAIVSHEGGELSAARAQLTEALELLQVAPDRQHIATALEATAGLSLMSSGPLEAARLWGFVQRLRDEFDNPRTSFEVKRYDRLVAAARGGLRDEDAFDHAWVEGQSLTLDGAVTHALATLRGLDADASFDAKLT